MCSCRRQLRSAARWTNVLVGVLGLALTCFGIYLAVVLSTSEAALYVLALLLGTIDMTLGFLAAIFGYKSIRFMRVYAVVVGLADLMQIILLVLFTVPDAQDATFNAVHLPNTARKILREYSTAVGALFVVIVLLQLVALLLMLIRCANLDEHYDSDTEESGLLGHYKPVRGGTSSPSRAQPSSAATSLGGLLEEDPPSPPSAPRLTYSILHDKYARR